jgi:pimeloyl-ACP methyl ester carboxylesterase
MQIKFRSYFKNPEADQAWFTGWVNQLEQTNGKKYTPVYLSTALGKTQVYTLYPVQPHLDNLVIFPGARTSVLIWDFDNGLHELAKKFNLYLVETNGLPNLSDGNTPDIHTLDLGYWAKEVLDQLHIHQTFIAGASYGGLICMKLALVAPEKIKACFLLNPGCLQSFSMKGKNLYYNLLPLIFPNRKNIRQFLNKAVFCKPNHQLSPQAEELLLSYELFAIKRYRDHTQKPYYMGAALKQVNVDTFLLIGTHDLLFPYKKSIKNAQTHLKKLKEVCIFNQVGHGIETYAPAVQTMMDKMKNYTVVEHTAV